MRKKIKPSRNHILFCFSIFMLLCVSLTLRAEFVYSLVNEAAGNQDGHTLSGNIVFHTICGTTCVESDIISATYDVTGTHPHSRTVGPGPDINFGNHGGFLEVTATEVILDLSDTTADRRLIHGEFSIGGAGPLGQIIWGQHQVTDIPPTYISFSSSGLSWDTIPEPAKYVIAIRSPDKIPGDFDENGVLNADDIDILSLAIRAQIPNFDRELDLNSDMILDQADLKIWVETIGRTYFGDSNFDGEFNSSDLVTVFESGEYEDGMEFNSTWSEGDWSGDGEFDSSDLVLAFSDGGYELGPRPTVERVPEPTTTVYFLFCFAALYARLVREAQFRRR